MEPLETEGEYASSRQAIVSVVGRKYRTDYEALAGSFDDSPDHVDRIFANVGKFIEAFERQLQPRRSPFDRYVEALKRGELSGGGHLTSAARRGLRAFVGSAGCISCHNGPHFTDRQFHNLGLPPVPGLPAHDRGRADGLALIRADEFRCGGTFSDTQDCPETRFLPSKTAESVGAFKTPGLRNVALTAPYMHTGQFQTLEEVIAFYRVLPGEAQLGRRDHTLRPIERSVATADLLAFLRSLTGEED